MMTTFIQTEDSDTEQWRILGQFSYPANIHRHFVQNGISEPPDGLVEFISAALSQAQEYFSVARNAQLTISPLLYYYGASNLLCGVGALLSGFQLPIEHHGMLAEMPSRNNNQIADLVIKPVNPQNGALQLLANVFSHEPEIVNGGAWDFGEILGSIPDLRSEYEQMYVDRRPYTLPVEVLKTRRGEVERIALIHTTRLRDVPGTLKQIKDFQKAYLEPQIKDHFVFLRKKLRDHEIGERSIFGGKHLQLTHEKNGRQFAPSQIILMFMGLFGLGFVSRYRPEIWNRFVTRDETGERQLILKFIDTCHRFLPNLALNRIRGEIVQFVNRIDQPTDLRTSLTDDDIKKLERLG